MLHPSHAGWLAHDTPGGFSALMDLYECNYINMRRLLPIMPPASAARVSHASGGMDLHLRIVERCRYTSELILTYQFGQEQGPPVAEPDLRIRVYHDARLAEVVAAHLRHSAFLATDPLDRWSLSRPRFRQARPTVQWWPLITMRMIRLLNDRNLVN